jgi:hypothetical protein
MNGGPINISQVKSTHINLMTLFAPPQISGLQNYRWLFNYIGKVLPPMFLGSKIRLRKLAGVSD